MVATTIVQSKHLLELGLDPKTADMCWEMEKENWLLNVGRKSAQVNRGFAIPAWSLSALLEVMPEFYPELHLYRDGDWYCRCDQVESEYCDDPIIAVYDVVCWLLDHSAIKNIHEHE